MLKNYFTTAIRNFWRNKTFSLINIIGLSIGISASLVIFLLVQYDFTFDKFEKDSDRIYRVVTDFTFSGEPSHNGGVTAPLPNTVRKNLTGAETVAPIWAWEEATISIPYPTPAKPTILRKEKHIAFIDREYFSLVPYTWLAGTPATALSEPYQTVLTEEKANSFFPNLRPDQVLGKTLTLNDTVHLTVTGIVRPPLGNTDFTFTTFISRITQETTSFQPSEWTDWSSTNSSSQLFIKLSPGTSPKQFAAAINRLYKANAKEEKDSHTTTEYALQPLSDVHFNAPYDTPDESRVAHRPTLYGLLAVATFLLLLACINFINLTPAQASQRAKEIGIRKTMGSRRGQLIAQFLGETLLLTFLATLLSIALTPLLLKVFADFIPTDLHISLSRQPEIIGFLGALILVVAILSGLYPALVLSGFKPVLVLKNQAYADTGKTRSAWFRKSLTVFQFVIAQVFIIATLLVAKQINYALNMDLGFKKEAIITFRPDFRSDPAKSPVLLQKLKAIPGIAMISMSTSPPTTTSTWSSIITYNDGKKEISTEVQIKKADSNYMPLYHFRMLAGSYLPESDTTNALVINGTYARTLGFTDPQKALGKTLNWHGHPVIVGVVEDFHPKSLRDPIKPLLIANGKRAATVFNLALQPKNPASWQPTIARIKQTYKELYPEDDFDPSFIDDTIAKFYTTEKNISKLLLWATGLTIFISCLGLLGLVIYITNQRTKEIGIRKVIGATITQLILLLSRDFLKLIGLAILIALPIAWWGSWKWLGNFAYKTSLSWWVFVAGGASLLFIALLILCIRTLRAATANPVTALRSE